MGIGLMRVEIELAVLAALAAAVPAVSLLFWRLFNGTVGATPPLRAILSSQPYKTRK
jgi:hypothetical protein